jgi:hypothetical protein
MEAVVIFSFLLALALLAPRFGRDSRARPGSDEEVLAGQGFTWDHAAGLKP